MGELAGAWEIAVKSGDHGRANGIHALGRTFVTHVSKAGVPFREALAAMRHSDPRLTAEV